jgi:hypothetical protein
MIDIKVDALQINLTGAEGHEHRIRPVATRAAAIFAERVEVYCGEDRGASSSRKVDSVNAGPLNVDLTSLTDEQAAQSIAKAWLDALALSLL